MDTRKFIKNLLFVTIALAGLIAAGLILFSPSGDVVSNGIITALLILLTDGFILVGLVSRYEWLKVTTWIASLYALIVAVVYTWLPNQYDVERYSPNNAGQSYDYSNSSGGASEILGNLTAGAYIILVTLAFVCVFSLISKTRTIVEKENVPYYSYAGAIALAIFSGVVLGMAASWDTEGIVLRLGFSLMFLSFTATFIMIVAIIISTSKNSKERMMQGANSQPPYNPYAQHVQQQEMSQQHQNGMQGQQGQGMNNYAGSTSTQTQQGRGAYNSQTLRNEPQNQYQVNDLNSNGHQHSVPPPNAPKVDQSRPQQQQAPQQQQTQQNQGDQTGYDYQETPTMGQKRNDDNGSNLNSPNQPFNGANVNDDTYRPDSVSSPSTGVPPRPDYAPTNQYPPKPTHSPTNHQK